MITDAQVARVCADTYDDGAAWTSLVAFGMPRGRDSLRSDRSAETKAGSPSAQE